MNTSQNILKILNKIKRLDIPIVKGSDHPMTYNKNEFAEEFHGKNGLEIDWDLPEDY